MSELITDHCPSCFVEFAIPKAMSEKKFRDGGSWYCPNGHSISYTTPTVDKVRAERDALKRQLEQASAAEARERKWRLEASAEAQQVTRQLRAQRGVTTRIKNRIAKGVCPCCNRTFQDLARHMATKHAGFLAEEVQQEEGTTIQ